jgi:hypothetical protein
MHDLDSDLETEEPVKMIVVFSHTKFKQLVPYPVIVESWQRIKSGKAKREWLKTFTEEERTRIAYYQKKFHDWYLISGAPFNITLKTKNLALLQRAVAFFAGV